MTKDHPRTAHDSPTRRPTVDRSAGTTPAGTIHYYQRSPDGQRLVVKTYRICTSHRGVGVSCAGDPGKPLRVPAAVWRNR